MDERESSTASSVDFYETDQRPLTPARNAPGATVAKRRAEELAPSPEKKRKLDSPSPTTCALTPCAGLPAAVWQHVFLSCSLHDLGRLLQVNRAFHSYLTDVRNVSLRDPDSGSLRLLKSESLWASARNALPVKPPKPLPGFSELQMWQLAWAKRCQFCQKESSFTPGEKIWQKGPGANGVRAVWPFGVKSCGPCLLNRRKTDVSLLFSNASALRPALPFAFITNDHNYIPAYTLQAATTPASVEIAKYYYKEHVDAITEELNDARSLGTAAAEEWSKGLEARGNERMKAAELWDRWEIKYQWWSDHNEAKRAPSAAPSTTPSTNQDSCRSPMHHTPSPIIHAPVPASKYSLFAVTAGEDGALQRLNHKPSVPSLTATAAVPSYMQPRPPTIPQQYTPQPTPGGTLQSSRGERNLHDANEAKANRKADIERRCQHMEPPIPPNVLRHMDSFRAALQISQPMTDYAWSVLQPRLLAQLPAAQQAEADHVSRLAALPRTADRRHTDVNSKEAKEVLDREWEELQRPVRDRLSSIADDFINQDWARGTAVTHDNSPKFAADLLLYVRRVFYAESAKKENPPDHDQSDKPTLVLENMKWVYDNKVKPLTEQYRKDLFLCYGTGCESNFRFYGFEGVIQHFGAKHTNAFSVGNVIVAWREAEWPEETPFHPDPISVKHAYHAPPSTASHGYGAYYSGYSRAGTSTPHVQSHLPQASPGPYHYGGHYNGPFAPPQMASAATPGYDYGQSYGAPTDPYPYQSAATSRYGAQTGNGYLTSPVMPTPAIVPPPPGPSQAQGIADTSHQSDEANHRTGLYGKQVSTVMELTQDIWKQTSGIKDLPNSLRIYVLLQRIISKFHVEFNHEPNLNHIIDAFSNQELPRALKDAPGLSCKACQDDPSSSVSRQEERRTYIALDLLYHFQSHHSGVPTSGYRNGYPANSLDWKEDMIELPSDRFISGLIHAPGMDDDKLHMVATVFPRLFPTPLPKIGVVDNHGGTSPAHSTSKDSKDALATAGTSGLPIDKSGPPSSGSPYTGSPRQSKTTDDGYDPERPALHNQANPPGRLPQRNRSYHGSTPPADRRPRYFAEPRYYVGSSQTLSERVMGADDSSLQLPTEPMDDDYSRPREYLEYASAPRRLRDPGPHYEDYQERRPVYREHEILYHPSHDDIVYAQPRDGAHTQEYRPSSRHVHYVEDRRPQYRYERVPRSRDPSPAEEKSAADRFLDEFVPGRPSTNESGPISAPPNAPATAELDLDDGSRYTPPPPSIPSTDQTARRPFNGPVHPKAPSTVSNGSRYEDCRPGGRQIPTPESGRGLRRPGPHRRRDRYHDHMPSRYARYMSIAREEPYSRAASMSRSQSKRYEQQRRRIDQQETPQPIPDQEMAYSRDHSVEHTAVDEAAYQAPQLPREYVSVQDRLHPYSPPRYRYSGYAEEPRGPAPVYVDKYGRPLEEYEIIRVPRDRGPYTPQPPVRYVERDEHVQYVPISYTRPQPQRYEDRPEYTYYDERQHSARRPVYEAEEAYEPPPPEIKVEQPAPVPDGS
ncbi:hypothetical protein K458DRAFT_391402 [Lentithecium fluviatile CBS 122367]|uniref:DUF7892 domain-containing protein n=1 Tax=Lentithecium fluviatile CBS 122367 TaxID=1168545 RepID=A0A6G1IV83_9PLEO|nr:hypothetical protein K458DRAFT_391402 [Lentithecium fluviatile CBS 122367]